METTSGNEMIGAEAHHFHYRTLRVRDIEPQWSPRTDSSGVIHEDLTSLKIGDGEYRTTDRFLHSMAARFGFGQSVFTLFSPAEVFSRLSERRKSDQIRLTTYRDTALAVSSPIRSIVQAEDLRGALRGLRGAPLRTSYADGVVTTLHDSPSGTMSVLGEDWNTQFTLTTPVDGYGLPTAHLSVMRLVCLNGMVALDPAFRSEFQLGKVGDSPVDGLIRQLNSFSNEEGFSAIASRLRAARVTPPSMREVAVLDNLLASCLRFDTNLSNRILTRASEVFGDISEMFHVSSVDALPPARRAVLQMRGTVADAINIATEVSSHILTDPSSRRPVNAFVGAMLTNPYDLEGIEVADTPKSLYLH